MVNFQIYSECIFFGNVSSNCVRVIPASICALHSPSKLIHAIIFLNCLIIYLEKNWVQYTLLDQTLTDLVKEK